MSLTPEEKQAVMDCKYFGDYWGEKDKGLCPCSVVAKLRGAEFDIYPPDPTCPGDYYFYTSKSTDIIWDAVDDVAEWLNIPRHEFFDTLSAEREKILERAPKD